MKKLTTDKFSMPSPNDIDLLSVLNDENLQVWQRRVIGRIIATMQDDGQWREFDICDGEDPLYSNSSQNELENFDELASLGVLDIITHKPHFKQVYCVTPDIIKSMPIALGTSRSQPKRIADAASTGMASTEISEYDPYDILDSVKPSDLDIQRMLSLGGYGYERLHLMLASMTLLSLQNNDTWTGVHESSPIFHEAAINAALDENLLRQNDGSIEIGEEFFEYCADAIKNDLLRICVENGWTKEHAQGVLDFCNKLPELLIAFAAQSPKLINDISDKAGYGELGGYRFKTGLSEDGNTYQALTLPRGVAEVSGDFAVYKEQGKQAIFALENGFYKSKMHAFAPVDLISDSWKREKAFTPIFKHFETLVKEEWQNFLLVSDPSLEI
ncbi:MAG: hypothetical protein FWE31_03250 [Firmicutes bacterium]|nr:hypothetical protein [Bacillota bacterium]